MDLHTIKEVKRPHSADEIVQWRSGYAWLGGGTWLFSEPQIAVDTLIDLQTLRWPDLTVTDAGLEIAATCPIGHLESFAAPADWAAAPLLPECVHALLMSFKVARVATVGGNICMSLPAGAMISLTASLEGVYTLWPRSGGERQVKAVDFVTGNHANVLLPGELLRSVHLPASALRKRFAFRRMSLTHYGRSAAIVVGTQTRGTDDLVLTVTAAVPCPVQMHFAHLPDAAGLRNAITERIGDDWFDDVHGSAPYKRHLTYAFAEQVRAELAQPEPVT
jgi:CO/xanthine dehydrogenase FAD-binding subunit